jgi:hypothetical protein
VTVHRRGIRCVAAGPAENLRGGRVRWPNRPLTERGQNNSVFRGYSLVPAAQMHDRRPARRLVAVDRGQSLRPHETAALSCEERGRG